jgi:hypothetical protein
MTVGGSKRRERENAWQGIGLLLFPSMPIESGQTEKVSKIP